MTIVHVTIESIDVYLHGGRQILRVSLAPEDWERLDCLEKGDVLNILVEDGE